ncbi:MAG: glycosyltransferase family 4 protein, partial [Candidatus Dormibacteraeota bacterium]|nr:glycosyltransferase family 4 protein [Candidatus Dormibacteraeota bacterium]
MRVTLASYDDEPALGGQGVMLAGIRSALVERGAAVDTVAGRGAHAIRYPKLLHRGPLDFSLQLNRTPSLLTWRNPDVVHALGGPGGVLLIRRLEVPLVYTANHTYRQAHRRGAPKRVLAPLETRAYRQAHTVLALSPSTATSLRDMGVEGNRIEVLMPGVEVPADVAASREERRVLFAGRLEAEKGALDAINVMLALLRSGAASSAAVVGIGSLRNEVRTR